MKYNIFKRYKFTTIFKTFNFKRFKLFTTIKNIKFNPPKFSRIYNYMYFRKYNFSRIYSKYFNLAPKFSRIYNYMYFRKYNFSKIYSKYFNLKRHKINIIYFIVFIVLIFFIYLSAPIFFKFDKSSLKDVVCKDFKIECSITGKINYSFFPSPRIKIKNFVIKDFTMKNKNLASIENVTLKLSLFNLTNKRKFNFTEIKFENAQFKINLINFIQYRNFFKKEINSKPIKLKNGAINFFENDKYLTSLENINLNYKTGTKSDQIILRGKILDDNINVNFINKKEDGNLSKTYKIKLLNFNLFSKIEFKDSQTNKDTINGKALFKQGKNRLTVVFDYKDKKIKIKQANLRNYFVDGKFNGEIDFLPYFNFNIDLDLNSINFNKLYSALVSLNEQNQKNLFKINKKINGKLNIFGDKIFSKYTLINSFESRLQFINGNILIEQLLLNLGKLGAADVTGVIHNDKKFSNFKFENNIFVDNLKKFYNKFGIYNKKKTSSNIFVSGNFDLINLNLFLNEISQDVKMNEEDLTFIEKEFNNVLLEDGYKSLFDFLTLKEFVKIITSEDIN